MEKLIVKNFLNLKNIEFEINKINLIIGKQAEGKSNLAKLVYFFKDFKNLYQRSIIRATPYNSFVHSLMKKFEEIFPKYVWKNTEFYLEYFFFDEKIILNTKYENNNLKLSIKLSSKLKVEYNNLLQNYKLSSSEAKKAKRFNDSISDLKQIDLIQSIDKLFDLEEIIFIPAIRSFLSNLQDKIFTFIKNDYSVDYFTKEFGANLESSRTCYLNDSNNKLKEILEKIIKGKYNYSNSQDWIQLADNKLIKLKDSSSGQQEALHMLIILYSLTNPYYSPSNEFIIVEEPEAHLFPLTQKNLVEYFSEIFNIHNNKQNHFFITTHSPYILTSFNNLIQADNTYNSILEKDSKDKDAQLKKLHKIIPRNRHISFDDVSAYYLANGKLKDIKNYENKLIDANAIDDVSDEIGEEFGKLLDIEFGEDN